MNSLKLLSVLVVALAANCALAIAPKITHAPVTTAIRGVPTLLHCSVEAYGLLLTQKVARVRLSESGTPSTLQLVKADDGYEALVPVPMVEGIHAFWYSLDLSNEKGETSSTVWQRVVIVEAAADGKGGASASAAGGGGGGGGGGAGGGAAGGAGGAGGEGIGNNPATWIGGGILLIGAGFGINELVDGDSGSGGSGGKNPPTIVTNKPTKRQTTSPYACTGLSGLEQVTYENLTVSNNSPIIIRVCRTCTNATISAYGSWESDDEIANFNNPNCNGGAPTLSLNKPGFTTEPNGTYTIDVYSNGQLIDSIPWPQDQDPFINFRPGRPKIGK